MSLQCLRHGVTREEVSVPSHVKLRVRAILLVPVWCSCCKLFVGLCDLAWLSLAWLSLAHTRAHTHPAPATFLLIPVNLSLHRSLLSFSPCLALSFSLSLPPPSLSLSLLSLSLSLSLSPDVPPLPEIHPTDRQSFSQLLGPGAESHS